MFTHTLTNNFGSYLAIKKSIKRLNLYIKMLVKQQW